MSGWYKNIFVLEKKVTKFKAYCIQLAYNTPSFIYKIFQFHFHLFDNNYPLYFKILFFGDLLRLEISYSVKRDHAGFMFDLTILGVMFMVQTYDIRHWDDENERWEEK